MRSTDAKTRYAFLDGIRGLTALYVVLNHVWARFVLSPEVLPAWFHLLKFGHAAVGIFIVLSGFCLMLPVARTPGYTVSGGIRGFLGRRAWRILPAYYAALTLSFLLCVTVPLLGVPVDLTLANALAHALLVHNWIPRFSITLNGPLWSIALEWQIYFVFVLLLLPLRRRFGLVAGLVAALVVGLVPLFLGYGPANPWFVLLFAIGMLGAELALSSPRSLSPRQGRGIVALTAATLLVHLVVWRDSFPWPTLPLASYASKVMLDLLLALTTVAWLVAGTRPSVPPLLAPTFRLLGSPPLVVLGSFSYSLYLMHDPLRAVPLRVLKPWINAAPLAVFPLVLVIIVPAVLGLCYLFHRVFERPFLRGL